MTYHEIRVRPVVRYIVTEYKSDDELNTASSASLGEFENVRNANRVGQILAETLSAQYESEGGRVVFEPARSLRIEWLRAPNDSTTRWELREEDLVLPPGVDRSTE